MAAAPPPDLPPQDELDSDGWLDEFDFHWRGCLECRDGGIAPCYYGRELKRRIATGLR